MAKSDLGKYKKSEWVKVFSGYWSLLSCCYLGYEHSKLIGQKLGCGPHRAIIVSHNGRCACHYDKSDLAEFGRNLVKKVVEDESLMTSWSSIVKRNTDVLMKFMKKQPSDLKSLKKNYPKFLELFHDYPAAYVAIKQVANFLPKELFERHISLCDETRLYSENVYTETEKFMRRFAGEISKANDYGVDLILSCTDKEFGQYLEKGILPDKSVLEERFKSNALVFENGVYTLVTRDEVKHLEGIMIGALGITEIKGAVAFRGLVKGKVRIVFDPSKFKNFEQGDILVTGMTRPEFLPLMKKAGAVVTDAGGILCHAAIVARELKIPTVIGTEKATKVLKDGDIVEVDANKGIVRKIKK
ncbi:MAG TPA: PEP-utilizing enzyme [Candidatus Nanoarchaeia archaeon]|nr:PEP-utilizing enzyme [Candidatus Nanoarchaeia archaeon]